jgi:hypothetical protein
MTTTEIPAVTVTVMPEFGGDGVTAHLPKRTAGFAFSGPTVYVTFCGKYAHGISRDYREPIATCVECHSHIV